MAIKLIVLDLDRTLLKNHFRIHPENKAALIKIQKQNKIPLVLASGRNPTNIIKFIKRLRIPNGPDIFAVTYNGGKVIDVNHGSNKIIFEKPFESNEIKILRQCAKKFDVQIALALNNEKAIILSKNNLKFKLIYKIYQHRKLKIIQYPSPINKSVIKVTVFGSTAKLKEFERALKATNQRFNLFWSNAKTSIEVSPYQISKLSGVKFICKKLNIAREEVMVFGDGMNDLELLKWAHWSFAMGQSLPEVKEAAKQVTDHFLNAGVAKTLKQFFPDTFK